MKRVFIGNVRSPVDLRIISFVDDPLDHVKIECLGQVLLDQGDPLLGRHLRHGGRCFSGELVVGKMSQSAMA